MTIAVAKHPRTLLVLLCLPVSGECREFQFSEIHLPVYLCAIGAARTTIVDPDRSIHTPPYAPLPSLCFFSYMSLLLYATETV
jgi:hypothetical protein